jgi:GT2 family glycosyltransferase
MESNDQQISVVLLTYNRVDELRRSLGKLLAMPEQPPVTVVDNASTDGTATTVAQCYGQVRLITLPRNIGGAGRNAGVRLATTPYVAFCDDDSWWEDGALDLAVEILDHYPDVAALCGRVLLGADCREDSTCAEMAHSPLPAEGLPGPALLGFIACAVVFRRDAYLEAGGYEARFFIGGEEELLTLDLAAAGWRIAYVPQLTVHHHPSPYRDNTARQIIVIRNALWVTWLRLPPASALKETLRIKRRAPSHQAWRGGLRQALHELPWVWRNRRMLPPQVAGLLRLLRG